MSDISNLYREILRKLPLPKDFKIDKSAEKIANGLSYLTSGYYADFEGIKNNASYDFLQNHNSSQEITIKNIKFISLCEHHLLPFFGHCEIVYTPNKKIMGFSRIAKIIRLLALRLQLQENFTRDIIRILVEILEPQALSVKTSATHTCMMLNNEQTEQQEIVILEKFVASQAQ